jgi:hypothetical protein
MAIPCGLFPSLFPSGSLEILKNNTNVALNVDTTGLVEYMTFPGDLDLSKQWISFENSQFRSWMQESAAIQLTRYWGKINGGISGDYKIRYQCKFFV